MTHPNLCDALSAIASIQDQAIERPEGDFEGTAINAPDLVACLPPQDASVILDAAPVLYEYTRKMGDFGPEPNQRALTELAKHGYRAVLQPSQENPDRLQGYIDIGDRRFDISDPDQ